MAYSMAYSMVMTVMFVTVVMPFRLLKKKKQNTCISADRVF